MSHDEFGEIGALFFELIELDAEERSAFLANRDLDADTVSRLESLLAAHDRDDDLLENPLTPRASCARSVASSSTTQLTT